MRYYIILYNKGYVMSEKSKMKQFLASVMAMGHMDMSSLDVDREDKGCTQTEEDRLRALNAAEQKRKRKAEKKRFEAELRERGKQKG